MTTDTTPLLTLPLIMPAQAQKHVTHNEALAGLDALVHLSVRSRALGSPPAASPAEGERYLVAAPAGGAFSGAAGKLAVFVDGAFRFFTPREGWVCWVEDEARLLVHRGGTWQVPDGPESLARLGLNAAPDSINRLSVSAPASLFSHEGAGHQMKINKNAAADTATLLFQTAFSGRAEIGLVGDDDFAFKVSGDGTSYVEAIRIARADGTVTAKTRPPAARIFQASGAWTKPEGLKRLLTLVVGGGGGGGGTVGNNADTGAGGGGGAGGTAVSLLDAAAIGASVAVTVGSGGAGAVGTASGGSPGGNSSFGGHSSGSSGGGGVSRAAAANLPAAPGGSGGSGSGGNLWNSEGNGGLGWQVPLNDLTSGSGGGSLLGAGGSGVNPNGDSVSNGRAAGSPGSGGSGAAVRGATTALGTGGRGADGLVVLVELY